MYPSFYGFPSFGCLSLSLSLSAFLCTPTSNYPKSVEVVQITLCMVRTACADLRAGEWATVLRSDPPRLIWFKLLFDCSKRRCKSLSFIPSFAGAEFVPSVLLRPSLSFRAISRPPPAGLLYAQHAQLVTPVAEAEAGAVYQHGVRYRRPKNHHQCPRGGVLHHDTGENIKHRKRW